MAIAQLKEGEQLRNFVAQIAKELVDSPSEVEVSVFEGKKVLVIELKVAKQDLGKIIGKQGRIANAIRTLLSAAATKLKKRAALEIIE